MVEGLLGHDQLLVLISFCIGKLSLLNKLALQAVKSQGDLTVLVKEDKPHRHQQDYFELFARAAWQFRGTVWILDDERGSWLGSKLAFQKY